MNVDNLHYSMHIQWSEEDQVYIVTVPELPGCKTHGDTYKKAVKNAKEVLELFVEDARRSGESLPAPRTINPVL
jgi:predicted RNase H-like HicB family nuclease